VVFSSIINRIFCLDTTLMIVRQQSYEYFIDKIFNFHLNENTDKMTHKHEDQHLCRYHRAKQRRHRNDKILQNKMNNNNYQKYVRQMIYSCVYLTIFFLLQLHSRKIIIFVFLHFYHSLYLSISLS
jgi:hypothetical protein